MTPSVIAPRSTSTVSLLTWYDAIGFTLIVILAVLVVLTLVARRSPETPSADLPMPIRRRVRFLKRLRVALGVLGIGVAVLSYLLTQVVGHADAGPYILAILAFYIPLQALQLAIERLVRVGRII